MVGAVAGYLRAAAIGAVLMRLVDAMLCFPTVFLLLALAAFIEPSVCTITLIIAATSWMEVARVVEAQIRTLRERDFAVAAEMIGRLGPLHHVPRADPERDRPDRRRGDADRRPRHPARNPTSASSATASSRRLPSWGNMLNNAQQYLTSAPWLAIFPGLAITLAVTSFNFVGDGLRDALDARLDVR